MGGRNTFDESIHHDNIPISVMNTLPGPNSFWNACGGGFPLHYAATL